MVNSVTSSVLPLHGAVSSLIGGRPENQDDFGWVDTPLGFLLVVCDGMGGGPGGKTASYLVKTAFMQTVYNSPAQANRQEVLRMAVARAEEALEQKMAEVPSLRGMGSTMVALLINEDLALVVHLGDSRCYRLRGSSVLFRSKDHSLVGELVRTGALTEEQARVSPQSNVITRGLGSTSNHVAEIDEVPYRRGDRFVLCTDGVWGIMPQPALLSRFALQQDVGHVVGVLQDEVDRIGASEGGHHDNHTLAIIEMNTDSNKKDPMSKLVKIVLATLSTLLLLSVIVNIVGISKIAKSDQAYRQTLAQLADQKALVSAYERNFSSTEKENIFQTRKLLMENEGLQQLVDELQARIDSLEEQLGRASEEQVKQHGKKAEQKAQKPSKQAAAVQTQQQATAAKAQVSEPVEPRKLAQTIMNRYDDLSKVKEKDLTGAIHRVKEIRDDISAKLDELGKYSLNIDRTNHIKECLPKDAEIARSIGAQEGKYFPNTFLINSFNKSLKMVEELKEKLK